MTRQIAIATLLGFIALHPAGSTPASAQCTDPSPINSCSPGGGSATTDCDLEWLVTPVPPLKNGIPTTRLVCYEGDAGCDFDADITNKSCTFHTALCINNADPRLSACTPSGILALEVKRPNPAHPADSADVANVSVLEGQAGDGLGGFGVSVLRGGTTVFPGTANGTANLCSAALDLIVPLRVPNAGPAKKGKKTLRVQTTDALGRRDTDVLLLECRPSSCGNRVVDPTETCDDGNRNDGDGCSQGCQIETFPTFTPSPPPFATATPTITNTATVTPTGEPNAVTLTLLPGSSTCRGTCVNGDNAGASCINNTPCTGGGTCGNRTCDGGPLDGVPCAIATDCNGCRQAPPQGSCIHISTGLISPIAIPLNGVCMPRIPVDTACASDVDCPSGGTCEFARIDVVQGTPDGMQEAPLLMPGAYAVFNPARVPGIGIFCLRAAGDGLGVIDCDGGRADLNADTSLDHNTTPSSPGNGGGLPDDPECDNTCLLPDGSTSVACLEGTSRCVGGVNPGALCTGPADCMGGTCLPCNPSAPHPGVCNSPTCTATSGTFGTGDFAVAMATSLTVLPADGSQNGPDGLPCTGDDTAPSPPSSLLRLTTGSSAATIFDVSNSPGASISPTAICGGVPCVASVAGVPVSCANLSGGMAAGLKFGAVISAIDAVSGDFVGTFRFVVQ